MRMRITTGSRILKLLKEGDFTALQIRDALGRYPWPPPYGILRGLMARGLVHRMKLPPIEIRGNRPAFLYYLTDHGEFIADSPTKLYDLDEDITAEIAITAVTTLVFFLLLIGSAFFLWWVMTP